MPAALLGVAAILLLGPVIGRALLAERAVQFWQPFQGEVAPEPIEQGRFLISLAVPLLLAACTVVGVRRRPAWRASRASDALVVAIQLAAVFFVAICLWQEKVEPLFTTEQPDPILIRYFTVRQLIVAAVGTSLTLLALRRPDVRAAVRRATRDTRGRTVLAGLVAVAAITIWLLHAFNTEGTLGMMPHEVWYHVEFTLNETFAVLDGRSPLVDYATQYGSLFPYLFAAGMSLLGLSVGVWTTLALVATGLGMLAIFAVLRRAAGSAILGLLLFLPVLSTSFFRIAGTPQYRYTFADYFGTFPMRYAGPSVLVWLVARHLHGARPRYGALVFLAAGLVVLNNVDVGIPALGATVAALVWSSTRLDRSSLVRLASEATAGLVGAFALVSVLTLARTGSLPHLELLFRFTWLFASAGFGMHPMHTLGLHVIIYLTFVAALGVATARALRPEPDRLLTGLLAWAGTFGLGAGAYFAARSTPDDLFAIFFPWSFAVALLTICAVRSLAGRPWQRSAVASTLCLFAFFVTACSLAQTPTPWEQLQRLRQTEQPLLTGVSDPPFVAAHTKRGEAVLLLGQLGHRVGAMVGVRNVSPYSGILSMPAREQLIEAIRLLRRAGGHKIFLHRVYTTTEMQQLLTQFGFVFETEDEGASEVLWVDQRAPGAPR